MTRFARRALLIALTAAAGLGCSAVLPPGFGQSSPAPSAVTSAPSLKSEITPILQQHCAKCHGGGSGAGGLTMFDAAGAVQHTTVKARMADMIAAIRAKRMPMDNPGGVPEDQIKKLEAWNTAGGPNN